MKLFPNFYKLPFDCILIPLHTNYGLCFKSTCLLLSFNQYIEKHVGF